MIHPVVNGLLRKKLSPLHKLSPATIYADSRGILFRRLHILPATIYADFRGMNCRAT